MGEIKKTILFDSDVTKLNKMKSLAFIWDIDGTLIDSYDSIIHGICDIARETKLDMSRDDIYKVCKQDSVTAMIRILSEHSGLPMDKMLRWYKDVTHEYIPEIPEIEGASATLKQLQDMGAQLYIFTHRGGTTHVVLPQLGMYHFFIDFVTARDPQFVRKPAPDSINYLVNKYGLDPEYTYYVGDRSIDIESAHNAGIKSILLLPEGSCITPTGLETFVVKRLSEIPRLV